MPPKIFITHSWHDIEFARRVSADLISNGLEIWFDDKTLQGGQRIAEEISRGLEWCDIYVPILSQEAIDSPWCWEEINGAISLSNDLTREGRPRIIPVLIRKCVMPALLRGRLYIDFTGQYSVAFNKLLAAIDTFRTELERKDHERAAREKAETERSGQKEAERRRIAKEKAEAEGYARDGAEIGQLGREEAEQERHTKLAAFFQHLRETVQQVRSALRLLFQYRVKIAIPAAVIMVLCVSVWRVSSLLSGFPTPQPPTQVAQLTDTRTLTLTPTSTQTSTSTPTPLPSSTSTPTPLPSSTSTPTPLTSSTPMPTATPTVERKRLDIDRNGYVVSTNLANGLQSLVFQPIMGVTQYSVVSSHVRSAAWSSDGRQVLVSHYYGWSDCYMDKSQLTKMNEDGSSQKVIAEMTGTGQSWSWGEGCRYPSGGFQDAIWSPDGQRIAVYRLYDPPGNRCPFVLNADGSGIRMLDACERDDRPRYWSVDGKWVIALTTGPQRFVALAVDGKQRIGLGQLGPIPMYDQRYYPWLVVTTPQCDFPSGYDLDNGIFWYCR